jgi:hypothetical protein
MSGTAGATIKLRRDTTANWAAANPILAVGEPGINTDTNGIKYGDGVTAWNSLPYAGIVPSATGNLIPALGNTYTLGNVTNPWASLYVSGNTIYLGNVVLTATGNAFTINGNTVPVANGNATFASVSTTGNVNVGGQISVAGNVTGAYFSGNGAGLTNVTAANIGTISSLSVTGNVTANYFVGNGSALTSVMADRGADLNNWNSMTQMGVYTVNRTSWSGTTNTPLDSQVYVGLVEVMNSTGTALSQVFYPGTVESGNVKIQWNRTYWSGSWSSWIKIINDDQVVVGGAY